MSAPPKKGYDSLASPTRGPLTAACMSMILMGATMVMTGALLPAIVADLQLDTAQAGLLVSSPALGYIVAAASAGLLGDLLGFRRVWLLGAVAGFATLLAIAGAPSFAWLLPAAGALGLVAGFFDSSIDPLLVSLTRERSGGILNRVHLFFGVGATLAPLLVGLGLRQGLGWRWHYASLTVYVVVVALAIWQTKLPPRSPREAGHIFPWKQLLASRVVLLSALAMLIYGGVENSIFSWTALYLTRERNIAMATASLGVSAFSVTMLFGRLICSWLVERIGYKRLVVGGALLGAVGLAWLLVLPGQIWPWLGLGLCGLALAGLFATIVARATNQVPQYMGTVAGLVLASSGLGKISLPWLVGQVAQGSNLSNGLWLAVAFAVLMALVYALT
jgi:fucose permease